MPDEARTCELYGHECAALTHAWRKYNDLRDDYVVLLHELRVRREAAAEMHSKPPGERMCCAGCDLLAKSKSRMRNGEVHRPR